MTFFSGTDQSTLQKEGSDRNNFVSLIVNNDGNYTAGITRKVEYTENHLITITGNYPFFGSRQTFNVPETNTSEEKVKTVIEWFELEIEKAAVPVEVDEYAERFNAIKNKVAKPASSTPAYGGTSNYPYHPYGGPYDYGYSGKFWDDDDDEIYYRGATTTPEEKKEEEKPKENPNDNELYAEMMLFDEHLLPLSLATPILTDPFNDLVMQLLTGCPIVSFWVEPSKVTKGVLNSILQQFSEHSPYDQKEYGAFVFDNCQRTFALIDAEDYFPKYIVNKEEYAVYRFEDVLLIKILEYVHTLNQGYLRNAIEDAIREFFNLT